MFNWDDHVGRDPLTCASTGRSIEPGERYACALLFDAGRFVRTTHVAEAWTDELAAAAVAHWWRTRPAAEEAQGPRLVDHQVLLEIFHQLREATDRPRQCLLWIITLILVRARKLRYVDLVHDDEGTAMLVREVGTNRKRGFRITDPELTDGETARLQEDVTRLFEEGVPTDDLAERIGMAELAAEADPDPREAQRGGGGDDSMESGGGSSPQPPA